MGASRMGVEALWFAIPELADSKDRFLGDKVSGLAGVELLVEAGELAGVTSILGRGRGWRARSSACKGSSGA